MRNKLSYEVAFPSVLFFLSCFFCLSPFWTFVLYLISYLFCIFFFFLGMAQSQGWVKRYFKAFCKGFFVAVPVAVTFLDRVACVARVEGASMQVKMNATPFLKAHASLFLEQ